MQLTDTRPSTIPPPEKQRFKSVNFLRSQRPGIASV